MDKNIKAELSALRSEVLTNLKSLELVVNNINSKLGQLDIDDDGIPTKLEDTDIALIEARAWIKGIDDKIDKIEADREARTQGFLHNDKPYVDPIDAKTMYKRFLYASHSHEQLYEDFVMSWAKMKKKRIESLIDTLRIFITDVQARKCLDHKVNDLITAERIVREFKDINRFKQVVIDKCTDVYPALQALLKEDHENDFVEYYSIASKFINDIEHQLEMTLKCNEYFVKDVIDLLKTMLDQQELNMCDPGHVLDPNTFEAVQLPADKALKHKQAVLTKYKGELKIAFEVYNSKQAHTEIVV